MLLNVSNIVFLSHMSFFITTELKTTEFLDMSSVTYDICQVCGSYQCPNCPEPSFYLSSSTQAAPSVMLLLGTALTLTLWPTLLSLKAGLSMVKFSERTLRVALIQFGNVLSMVNVYCQNWIIMTIRELRRIVQSVRQICSILQAVIYQEGIYLMFASSLISAVKPIVASLFILFISLTLHNLTSPHETAFREHIEPVVR